MIPTNSNKNNDSVTFNQPRFYAIKNALWSLVHRIASLVNQIFESIKKIFASSPAQTSQKEFKAAPVSGPSKVDEAIGNMDSPPIPTAPKSEPKPEPKPVPQPPLEPQPIAENQEELVRKRQELAAQIAAEKIPLGDLNLSEAEMLVLAPYLTYLELSGSKFTNEFTGKLLVKTEQLNHLLINVPNFDGFAFKKFKNVEQLQTLEIRESQYFNQPLPDGMISLKKLVIHDCLRYDRPFPQRMGALESLEISSCPLFNQPIPENLAGLKSLTISGCDDTTQLFLPNKMIALENLEISGCKSPLRIPKSMPALKTLKLPSLPGTSDWHYVYRDSYWTPLLEIYLIDRERGLRFVSEALRENEKEILYQLFVREKCLDEGKKNYRMLADNIAKYKNSLNSLRLSEGEMLELAPYLTYLKLSDATYTEEFIGTLLEKTEKLSVLKIKCCSFTGVAFSRFINVGQLRILSIIESEFEDNKFRSPLPEGMEALQELEIRSKLYNHPFPKGMGNLQKLKLSGCTNYNQPFPEHMDALKSLVIIDCYRVNELPRKLDALEELVIEVMKSGMQFPRSMPSLKTLKCEVLDSEGLIPAIYDIYKIDRARGIQLSAQIGKTEKALLLHQFQNYSREKTLDLIDKITPEELWNLNRREDIPFVHDDILKDDPLHQLYIYYIYSRIQANSANLVEDTELIKTVLAHIVGLPQNQNLMNFYESLDKFEYTDLIPLFQWIVADQNFDNLNIEKKLQFITYQSLCSRNRAVLLKNLINLDKSGRLTPIQRLIPKAELAEILSEKQLFTGNLGEDRKTGNQMLADKIAKDKLSLTKLNLSEDEMIDLAPYLTYLDMDSPWIPDNRVNDFMCRLLENAEQIGHLRLKWITFDGSALARIKNPGKLESLEIRYCRNFNEPLPAGMDSLRSLVIQDCKAFNQPLPVIPAQLHNLVIPSCNVLKSNSLLNSIMPIIRNDRERGLKLGASLGFDAEFLQIYSEIWSEGNPPDSDTYYRTLAKYIADKKISIKKLKERLSEDELLELAPHLTYLDGREIYADGSEFLSELLEKSVKVEHLCLNVSILPNFKNIGNLQALTINAEFEDLTLPEGMAALRHLTIERNRSVTFPKGMTSLESLHFRDCMDFNQRLPEDLTGLRELSFEYCSQYNQPLPSGMLALESIRIFKCGSFNSDSLLSLILSIYEVDHDRGIKLAASLASSLGILARLENYIQFCESDDDDTIATMLPTLMRADLSFPPSALKKIEEFMKRDADRGGSFVQGNRDDLLKHPQLREKLFSVYPLDKPEYFALFNTVKLQNNILYLTLLPKAALDFPDALFRQIRQYLLGDERIARLNVQFHGSPGIDAGGLSRQLITQFIQGLLSNSKMFKFETTDNGKVIPQATTSLTDEDIINYAALGTFLGIAYRQKNPTGEVFSEKWLQCIFSLKNDLDGDISEFLKQMDHTGLKMFMEDCVEHNEQRLKAYGTVLTSTDKTEVIATAAALDEDLADDNLAIEEIRNRVRKDWIAPNVITYLRMAQAMALGMRKALLVQNWDTGDTYWEDLSSMTTEEFSLRLQGKLSADWIKRNVSFTPENNPKALEVKAWLNEWLDKYRNDHAKLANLVQTLTGARALLAPITFGIRSEVASVYPHTCSSEVDVPDNIDKETFTAILKSYGKGKDLDFTRM